MDDQRVNVLVDSFKKATSEGITIEGIILLVLVFSFITLALTLGNYLRKFLSEKGQKSHFIKTAEEMGLTEEEAIILWTYAKKLDRDPYLTLEVKATFEKVIDEYVKSDQNFNEDLIQHMREALGFDVVPPFFPLVSTKDIEIYQAGTLITEGLSYNVALAEKDELYMYWVVLDTARQAQLEIGQQVKITFLRQEDAIYSFENIIEDIYEELGRKYIKLPHTMHLARLQRRKEVRIRAELPVEVSIYLGKEEGILRINTKTEDISITGLKFCLRKSEEKAIMAFGLNAELTLEINITGSVIKARGIIRNIQDKGKRVCFGVELSNLDKKDKAFLSDFIQEKQMELIKQFKKVNKG